MSDEDQAALPQLQWATQALAADPEAQLGLFPVSADKPFELVDALVARWKARRAAAEPRRMTAQDTIDGHHLRLITEIREPGQQVIDPRRYLTRCVRSRAPARQRQGVMPDASLRSTRQGECFEFLPCQR